MRPHYTHTWCPARRVAKSQLFSRCWFAPKEGADHEDQVPKGSNGHRLWSESQVSRAFLLELMGECDIPEEGAYVVEVEPCPWLVGWCGDNNVRWIGLQGAYAPTKANWFASQISALATKHRNQDADSVNPQLNARLAECAAQVEGGRYQEMMLMIFHDRS